MRLNELTVGQIVTIPDACADHWKEGQTGTVVDYGRGKNVETINRYGVTVYCNGHDYELAVRDLDHLLRGDVLDSSDYYAPWTVQGTMGSIVFLTNKNDEAEMLSVEQIKRRGRKLKDAPAEPEVTELTLDQVAKKFGLDVANVRIKKED